MLRQARDFCGDPKGYWTVQPGNTRASARGMPTSPLARPVRGLYLSRRPRIALPRALLHLLAIEKEVCGHLLANLLTQGTGQTAMSLEDKLRGKLQDARVVRSGRGEECRGRAIVRSIARRIIYLAELRVIEDVEGLGAKLEAHRFVNGEVLEQAHIEVRAMGHVQHVASRVAVGESLRSGKRIAVEETRPRRSDGVPDCDRPVDRPDDVRVRLDRPCGTDDQGLTIAHDGVSRSGIVGILGIHDAERHARLKA